MKTFVIQTLNLCLVLYGHYGVLGRRNHDICLEILEDWWPQREAFKESIRVIELDEMCDNFSGDPIACTKRDSREAYSNLPGDVLDATCTVVGAHSEICRGNPCVQYNTGKCTIQDTAGYCVWYDETEVPLVNAHYESIGSDFRIRGHGCYRNPCNQAGKGKLSPSECEENSVAGVIECTYCKGSNDENLRGRGMGCQMTRLETTASCAAVNNMQYPNESIYMKVGETDCQCSDLYPACYHEVHGEDGRTLEGFERRFP